MTELTPSPSARKTALVTGALRRVGATIAKRLAVSGYQVICHVRNGSVEADQLVAQITSSGGAAHIVEADLVDVDARSKMMSGIGERFGALDLLVNNAAAFSSDRFEDYSESSLLYASRHQSESAD